jgi:hypothetical protein
MRDSSWIKSFLSPLVTFCIVLVVTRNGIDYLDMPTIEIYLQLEKLGKALNNLCIAQKWDLLDVISIEKSETNLSPSFMLSWSSTQNKCEHAYTALHWSGFFKSFAEYYTKKRHQKKEIQYKDNKIYINCCINKRTQ